MSGALLRRLEKLEEEYARRLARKKVWRIQWIEEKEIAERDCEVADVGN